MSSIGQPICQFVHLAAHMNNTIRVELAQQTHGARDSSLSFSPLIRYTHSTGAPRAANRFARRYFFPESNERFETHQQSCIFGDIIRDATEANVMSAMKIGGGLRHRQLKRMEKGSLASLMFCAAIRRPV